MSRTLRRNDYGKIGRATRRLPFFPPSPETAILLPFHRESENSNFVFIEYIYIFVRDDKHNENEIQVDASFKRIVNGINTK